MLPEAKSPLGSTKASGDTSHIWQTVRRVKDLCRQQEQTEMLKCGSWGGAAPETT